LSKRTPLLGGGCVIPPLTDPGLSGLIDEEEEEEDTMRRVHEYFINLLDLEKS